MKRGRHRGSNNTLQSSHTRVITSTTTQTSMDNRINTRTNTTMSTTTNNATYTRTTLSTTHIHLHALVHRMHPHYPFLTCVCLISTHFIHVRQCTHHTRLHLRTIVFSQCALQLFVNTKAITLIEYMTH